MWGENQPPKLVQKQSERLRNQGNNNIKITEKAEVPLAKKNLEGNSFSSQNSLAVLDNNDIIIKAGKLGIDSQNLSYEKIDLLRELEKARAGLKEKQTTSEVIVECVENTSLPSEELKFLEWHSEKSDDEGFQLVSSRQSRRKKELDS